MKNILKIISVLLIILSFSCTRSKSVNSYHYFKVVNTTNHNILLGLFTTDNVMLLKEYTILAKSEAIIDTAQYHFRTSSEAYHNNKIEYISGSGFKDIEQAYWFSHQTSFALDFNDGERLSSLQSTYVNTDCDTLSLNINKPCNYGTKEMIVGDTKAKEYDIEQTVTYYITNQQYLSAEIL